MGERYTRKRVYVDRHVQGAIVLRLIFLWVAFMMLAIVISLFLQFCASPYEGFSYYWNNTGQSVFPLLMSFAVLLPIAVVDLMRLTNRFAGPILRLRRVMQELASGADVPPLHFRQHDFWQDLADQFNEISATCADERKRVKELEMQLDESQLQIANKSDLNLETNEVDT